MDAESQILIAGLLRLDALELEERATNERVMADILLKEAADILSELSESWMLDTDTSPRIAGDSLDAVPPQTSEASSFIELQSENHQIHAQETTNFDQSSQAYLDSASEPTWIKSVAVGDTATRTIYDVSSPSMGGDEFNLLSTCT